MTTFEHRLSQDSSLRDAFVEHLEGVIAHEAHIDRIDGTHPVEHQRGVIAVLRRLRSQTKALERPKEKEA
jgi:hypothetical protein